MAAQLTDKFKKVGASTVTTLAAPGKALAASSINVGSTTNYPTDTGIVIAIRTVDSNGDLVAGTYTEWNAIVSSGTSLTIATTPRYGSDRVYSAGSTTQVFIPLSSSAHNQLVDGLLVEHNQDGTHSDVTSDTITNAGLTTTDTLTVTTGTTLPAGDIGTADIADGAVTPDKWTNQYKFHAYRSTAWTSANNTYGKVLLNAEYYDTNNDFDSTTNYRYDVPVTGYYNISFSVGATVNSGGLFIADLRKNNTAIIPGTQVVQGAASIGARSTGSGTVLLTAGDYLELYFYGTGAAGGTGMQTFMSGFLVSLT